MGGGDVLGGFEGAGVDCFEGELGAFEDGGEVLFFDEDAWRGLLSIGGYGEGRKALTTAQDTNANGSHVCCCEDCC